MAIGIKETKEAIRAVVELKKAIENARADGSFNLKEDYGYFVPVALPAVTAFEGAGLIPAELDDLDDNEAAELTAEFGNGWKDPAFQKIFKGCALLAAGILDLNDNKAPAPTEEAA